MIYLKNTAAPQEVWIPRQDTNIHAEPKDCYTEGYDDGYNSGYEDGMKEGIPLQEKSVTISGNVTEVLPDAGYSAMTKVTADATEYAQGRYDAGYADGKAEFSLQYKSVSVDADEMEIFPDGGYDGLSRVDVDAVSYGKAKYNEGVASVPLQAKSVEVTSNGQQAVSPDEGYSGMSAVTLNVNVPTGSTIANQDKTVDLDLTGATASTAVTFDGDYTGLGTVTVNADATVYGNARYGEGQASVTLQEKSVTLTQSGITSISPDTGYSGMSSVTVNTPMQRYSKNINGSDPLYWDVDPSPGYIGFYQIHLDVQDLRRQVTQEGIAQGQIQITRQIKDLDVSANGTYTANTEGDKYLNFTGNSIYDLEVWMPDISHICIATIRTYPDSEGIIISNNNNTWSTLEWSSTVYGINISNSGTVVEFKDCGLYASGTITTGIWHTLEFSRDSGTNELIAKIDNILLTTSGEFNPKYDGNFTIGNTAVNVDWLNTKYNAFSTGTTTWNRDLIAQNDDEYRGIIAVVNEDYRQVAPSNGNYAIYKDDAVYGWSSVTVNVSVNAASLQQTEYDTTDPKSDSTIYLINDGDGIVRAYQGERLIYGDAPSE